MSDNPSAFPRSGRVIGEPVQEGMTLRDWFAGQALSSIMSTATGMANSDANQRDEEFADIAKWMYELADAMLAARSATA